MRETDCQERYKFIENPELYIENIIIAEKPYKKLFETNKHYTKRLAEYLKLSSKKNIKKLVEEYSKPIYVYYNEQKLAVPNSFYVDYKTPDIEGYINFLIKEDERKNIITDEDREKARLLNCNLDFNYLQTLINKMNLNPDLVITIKTRDGAVINMRKQDKKESEGILNNIFISPERVK